MNYYNDFDKNAVRWLRNMISAGLLPYGVVDDRPIQEVLPSDLIGYTQCHFFAGIGGWPLALRLAGWPEDRPVWTGSCPCQPFSVAGAGGGNDDPRALWWAFRWLIMQCRPAEVFGEQVASKDGRGWLAGVRSDLEAMGYTVGAADLCAAGVKEEGTVLLVGNDGYRRERVNLGPAHIRQRLYWVADSGSTRAGRDMGAAFSPETSGGGPWSTDGMRCGHISESCVATSGMAERTGVRGEQPADGEGRATCGSDTGVGGLAHPALSERTRLGRGEQEHLPGPSDWRLADDDDDKRRQEQCGTVAVHQGNGREEPQRRSIHLIPCGDGKARRLEPGLMPLVDGLPGRVAQIRGYGNAIHPGLAAEFITAYTEAHV